MNADVEAAGPGAVEEKAIASAAASLLGRRGKGIRSLRKSVVAKATAQKRWAARRRKFGPTGTRPVTNALRKKLGQAPATKEEILTLREKAALAHWKAKQAEELAKMSAQATADEPRTPPPPKADEVLPAPAPTPEADQPKQTKSNQAGPGELPPDHYDMRRELEKARYWAELGRQNRSRQEVAEDTHDYLRGSQ